eukprot:734583-Pelagomonas_calceolata.AAC.3
MQDLQTLHASRDRLNKAASSKTICAFSDTNIPFASLSEHMQLRQEALPCGHQMPNSCRQGMHIISLRAGYKCTASRQGINEKREEKRKQ